MSKVYTSTHYTDCATSANPPHVLTRVNKTQEGAIKRTTQDAYRAAEKYAYPNIVIVKGTRYSDDLAIIQVFNESTNDIVEEFMIKRIDLGE